MLSLFKKTISKRPDFSELGSDMHSHLIAGIDDGARDIEMAVSLAKGLSELGYKKLITTPHIMGDIYKNNDETISTGCIELCTALKENKMQVVVEAAAEYFMDDHFDQLLNDGVRLRTIKDNWVLVEFSFAGPPIGAKEKIFSMEIKGYQPILAHPERYLYFQANRPFFDELKEAGCYFQVNILSLCGYYGRGPFEASQYLTKKKYVDFLGTDLHHVRHLEVLQSSASVMVHVKSLLDTGKILNPSL